MSSFQGVGIEEFHCIFRVLSSTVYRGVLISGCGVPLYTSFQGVGIIKGFHCIQKCQGWNGFTVYRSALDSKMVGASRFNPNMHNAQDTLHMPPRT